MCLNEHSPTAEKKEVFLDPFRPLGSIMKDQRRFAPKGVRITPELVSGFTGISTKAQESHRERTGRT